MILLFEMRKRRDIFKIAVKLGRFMDLVVAFRKCHLSFCLLALPTHTPSKIDIKLSKNYRSSLFCHTLLSLHSEVTFLATPYLHKYGIGSEHTNRGKLW